MTRQTWLFIALGALSGAALLSSIGAWILLWRERRTRSRAPGSEGPEED
jgi:hypothetical protein